MSLDGLRVFQPVSVAVSFVAYYVYIKYRLNVPDVVIESASRIFGISVIAVSASCFTDFLEGKPGRIPLKEAYKPDVA